MSGRLTREEMDAALAAARSAIRDGEVSRAAFAEEFEQYRYRAPRPLWRAHRLVAATDKPVKDTVLDMVGCDLRAFNRNPVVMWGHRKDLLPIGRAACFVDGSRLIADVTLDRGDPLGREVDRKLRRGFLHAASITYDPENYYFTDDGVTVVIRWLLREVSITPSPADRGAVRDSQPGPLARLREVLGR